MARSDERAESLRVLREVRSNLTQLRTLCRQPTQVERKLKVLIKDVANAEKAVKNLPGVTRETRRGIMNKLEVVVRVLDIIGGHRSRRQELKPADYSVGLLDLVDTLSTKLDDAIDFVANAEKGMGNWPLRRRAHPTIDVRIESERRTAG
jgi:hypothetical protein